MSRKFPLPPLEAALTAADGEVFILEAVLRGEGLNLALRLAWAASFSEKVLEQRAHSSRAFTAVCHNNGNKLQHLLLTTKGFCDLQCIFCNKSMDASV